ncbi:repeat, TIGR02543 family [Bifidobacterium saguini DSM 23967]|uniref:Repeat, TIGR02543 family n=1 Tax=Bifidobacterium saguini DSM 23967 TaxID=1437607 RepID=A0A087D6V4_9BIFI|nr:repeat, TIGR02543 family [Bifidobacterium saguini DSM 23967]
MYDTFNDARAWRDWTGFNASRFGWTSDQEGGQPQGNGLTDHKGSVELQRDSATGNTYAEIVGSEINKSILQRIDTRNNTDAVYTIRFDHAALSSEHADSMQALVNGKPVEVTRVTSNLAGDPTGWRGTDIVTHATNGNRFHHDGQWATYEGQVTIPANTPVSTFSFKALNNVDPSKGNLIDNLTFTIAYKLDYDANGGAKSDASRISSKTTGESAETTGKVKTIQDSSSLPANAVAVADAGHENLVNGDFEYPADAAKGVDNPVWTAITPDGKRYTGCVTDQWQPISGFDKSRFGWSSSQTSGSYQGCGVNQRAAGAVELQVDNDGNQYAELTAAQAGTAIYQDVATTPGVAYTWTLKHASLTGEHADSMQVLIGQPGHETAQEAERVTSNGHGDTTGPVGTTITTKTTNTDSLDHADQWETYTGTYVATSTTTRFTFKSLSDWSQVKGNLLDDVSFKTAYKLNYQGNGGEGETPSSSKADSTQPAAFKSANAKTNGTVKPIADKTVKVPSYDLETSDVPGQYRDFILDTTKVKLSDVKFASGQWLETTYQGHDAYWPLTGDAYLTIPNVGSWTNPQGASHTIDATVSLASWNGGYVGDWNGHDFWLFAEQRSDDIPSKVTKALGGVDTSKRSGNSWTVRFTYSDGTPVPDTFKGVTGFNDLDGQDANPSIPFEGVELLSGFDGAYKTRDAELVSYGTNGYAGYKRDAGDESNLDGEIQVRHRLAATWTGASFTFGYNMDASYHGNAKTTFGVPVTRTQVLTYNGNGGTGKVPSHTDSDMVETANAKTNGTVRLAADSTGKVPVYDLESTDVPGQYRDFILDTTKTRLADARFDSDWVTSKDESGGNLYWPTRLGASVTLPDVGSWTDPQGVSHRINATLALKEWNGGNIGQLNSFDANNKIVGDGLFWINVVYRNDDVPAQVRRSLGGIDMSRRVGCQWTVSFTYEDGTSVPDSFHGVTGFNDLDGWDAQPDLAFEGVQLVGGFDGAYKTRDAELAAYGTNGWAGITRSVDESDLNGEQQVKHRLAATWTGASFTFSYDLKNPAGRTDGVHMTFGAPVTRSQVLTYKANGGTGKLPSHTTADSVEPAASTTVGTVKPIAGKSVSETPMALYDSTTEQADGSRQRTITRSDGSVRVETIDASTDTVAGCQVYYPAGTKITLATMEKDSDCWDSSMISKDHRTFYGWSANTDANDQDVPVTDTMDRATLDANKATEITMPARAKTVYALWAIDPTLTYDVNAPTGTTAPKAPEPQEVAYDTAAANASGWSEGETTRIPGYRFDGWYTSVDGNTKYDFASKLTSDTTIYAHWTPIGYTVHYEPNGGTGTMSDQPFTFDVPQNLTANAFTRDGWTFAGWKRQDTKDSYTDGQQVTNLTTTPDDTVTMLAQWTANPAGIHYEANPPAGNTANGEGTPDWTGVTGDTPSIGAIGWTTDGYTFTGWNTSPDGKGDSYAPGTTWNASGTLTLYAQWSAGEASLSYDGNGATGGGTAAQTGRTDEKVKVQANGFTRDGWTFTGWNTSADGKGTKVAEGADWTLKGHATLYAQWTAMKQTLTYDGNGATSGDTQPQNGVTGQTITTRSNGFTRDGYSFVRWDTGKDGDGTGYKENADYVMQPANNVLYAIWQADPASIVYKPCPTTGVDGGTPDTTGVTGQSVQLAENGFTRAGYTFQGWTTKCEAGNPTSPDAIVPPGTKLILTPGETPYYPVWKANPAHLVYQPNGGSGDAKTVDGVVDQTVTTIANPYQRTGYTFTGWNTSADGKGTQIGENADYTLTADEKAVPANTHVLYAQWTINTTTLHFDPNGGVGIGLEDLTGDALTTLTIPADYGKGKVTRPGFRFTGWSLEKTPADDTDLLQPGEGQVNLPAEGTVTVYAQWTPELTTLPYTGGRVRIPTIGLWITGMGLILMLGALTPLMRLHATASRRRNGRHTPNTGGRHAA